MKTTICPDCGGDGVETCNNPDHGFITSGLSVTNELTRLGCPCCGHDPNHKIKGCECDRCNGTGTINLWPNPMKPNNIVTIYISSFRCDHPEGPAKLIKLIEEVSNMEYWEGEFLDHPGKTYKRLIKA